MSFYLSHYLDADTPTPYSNNKDLTDTHNDDTKVELEGDWLTEPEVPEPMDVEPSRRTSSKTIKAMLIKISKYFLILMIKAYRHLLASNL